MDDRASHGGRPHIDRLGIRGWKLGIWKHCWACSGREAVSASACTKPPLLTFHCFQLHIMEERWCDCVHRNQTGTASNGQAFWMKGRNGGGKVGRRLVSGTMLL